MRWQPARLALLVGLCSVGLAGCANLKLLGDGANLGAATAAEAALPSPDGDACPHSGLSQVAKAADPATAKAPQANSLEGQFAMARLCERRGENDSAQDLYGELLKKAPRDARPHHRLGVLALQKGSFAEAEECLRTAQSLAPPTAELLSDIGYCYYLQYKLPEADTALMDALKLDPNYAMAINNLALVRGRQGRFPESFELFKRTNNEAEACANLAYVLAQNGELAQARDMYLRALTLDNGMRAAAQAALQIEEQSESRERLAAAGFSPHPFVPTANEPTQEPKEVVTLPEPAGRVPQPVGPELTARPPS